MVSVRDSTDKPFKIYTGFRYLRANTCKIVGSTSYQIVCFIAVEDRAGDSGGTLA
jgi:hypothetical protein